MRMRQDPRLDEMFFGDWQGLTKQEAASRNPARYAQWRCDPMVGAPAGESPFDVSARAVAAIDDLRARYDSGERSGRVAQDGAAPGALPAAQHRAAALPRVRRLADLRAHVIELGPCHAAARLVTDEHHLLPQPRRHLVGEQLAGWGQADAGFVDDDPAGGGAALDLELAPDHGIDAMTGAMSGAIDPAGGS